MPISEQTGQPSSNNSIGNEKVDDSNCDYHNTSINANDNTMATLNNLSICQQREEGLELKQNSKTLHSVSEEDNGVEDDIEAQNSSRSNRASGCPQEQTNQITQNKLPRTLAPIAVIGNQKSNKSILLNQNQQNLNSELNQSGKKDNLFESIRLSKIPSQKMGFPHMIPVAQPDEQDLKGPIRKASEQKLSCKICLDEQGPFITPCKCSGSCSFVHEKCLKDWILQQQKNKKKIQNVENNGNQEIVLFQTQLPEAKCEICQHKYQYQTVCRTKFSMDCFKKCDQSTQNFSTGFIGSLLSCFMIFLIVIMFTNNPFDSSSSSPSTDNTSPSNSSQYQSSPTHNGSNTDNGSDGEGSNSKGYLQYIFICLSFVILTAFLAITISCCKKALWLKKVVSWKILGFGKQEQAHNVELKVASVVPASVVPASVVTQTQINTTRNAPRVVQQMQVRSNTTRLLNQSQIQRNQQNNMMPFASIVNQVPNQPNQQRRIVVTESAMRTARN